MKVSTFEKRSNSRESEQPKDFSKSKLELSVLALEILVSNGPMNLKDIIQKTDFNCTNAVEYLSFLSKINMVKKTASDLTEIYSITNQGEMVVRFFRRKNSLLNNNKLVVESSLVKIF